MADTFIHHIALRVKDCAASARFYEQAFLLRQIRRVESEGALRAIWLRAGDTVLMLEHSIRGAGPAEGSGHALIFPTGDVAEAERRLAILGIAVTDRTLKTLYVQDPDGHRTGLSAHHFDETAS
jgi:catechol 2,3-dioxygenase-like lactoylglutathione lyase family enzyme